MSNVLFGLIATLVLLLGSLLVGSEATQVRESTTVSSSESVPSVEAPRYTVAQVIDGDTIDLAHGQRVRLLGIDAPEREECYYEVARDTLIKLVEGKEVRLERDQSETDKYDRWLRHVFVEEDEEGGEVFVNEILIEAGVATTLNIPPDDHYRAELKAAEAEAKANQRGLWSACR